MQWYGNFIDELRIREPVVKSVKSVKRGKYNNELAI